MLGSATFSTPDSPISFASSTIATTCAPVRFAMSTVSPMWSACPWVRKMWVGSTSPASTAALGLPVRNGSISTRVSPSLSSKHACPRNRMSMVSVLLSFLFELAGKFPAHGHADHHAHAGLVRHEYPERPQAGVLVGVGGGLEQLPLVSLAEPAALL